MMQVRGSWCGSSRPTRSLDMRGFPWRMRTSIRSSMRFRPTTPLRRGRISSDPGKAVRRQREPRCAARRRIACWRSKLSCTMLLRTGSAERLHSGKRVEQAAARPDARPAGSRALRTRLASRSMGGRLCGVGKEHITKQARFALRLRTTPRSKAINLAGRRNVRVLDVGCFETASTPG